VTLRARPYAVDYSNTRLLRTAETPCCCSPGSSFMQCQPRQHWNACSSIDMHAATLTCMQQHWQAYCLHKQTYSSFPLHELSTQHWHKRATWITPTFHALLALWCSKHDTNFQFFFHIIFSSFSLIFLIFLFSFSFFLLYPIRYPPILLKNQNLRQNSL
jgi:hypothetical protein